jgi:hypothetical protein
MWSAAATRSATLEARPVLANSPSLPPRPVKSKRSVARPSANSWLGVLPPPLDGDSVDGFVARHRGDYVALRAALAERPGTA